MKNFTAFIETTIQSAPIQVARESVQGKSKESHLSIVAIQPDTQSDFSKFVSAITKECVEGSGISPELLALNIEFIEDTGAWEVQEALDQEIKRFTEGNSETGQWNRNWQYQAIAMFKSESGEFFNGKPANPKPEYKQSKGFGQASTWYATGKVRKYEALKDGGVKVFKPAMDEASRRLMALTFGLDDVPMTDDIWPYIETRPQIHVATTEGVKKALSMTAEGFPCISLLGASTWSVPGSSPRQLLPELAALAAGGRLMPVWFDQDDPRTKLKTFLNVKQQGRQLVAALIEAGADPKSALMYWDRSLGKGFDDAKVSLAASGEDIQDWIWETIYTSKNAAIQSRIDYLYQVSPNRSIERVTDGNYMPNNIQLAKNQIHALIASTGSGKTTIISELVKLWIKLGGFAVIFAPTNRLGQQSSVTYGVPHRHDFFDTYSLSAKANADGGLVCCPDSIGILDKIIPTDRPLLVICDEADAIAGHITKGQTIKGNYSNVNKAFAQLLKRADAVIIAEDKLPESTLRFYEEISGKPTRTFIHNRTAGQYLATCFKGQVSAAIADILGRLERGEKLVIPMDSQRCGEALEKIIQEKMPHLKGMRVDQKTSHMDKIKELTYYPNQVLAREQLDYLIYSPSCKAGWDLTGFWIDERAGQASEVASDETLAALQGERQEYHFDAVWAVFQVLPTADQIQLLARLRLPVPRYIFVNEAIHTIGDERQGSIRRLSRERETSARQVADHYQLPYNASEAPALQTTIDNFYNVVTVRAGLEKSIAHHALCERLKASGHEVISLELVHEPEAAKLMKKAVESIEREWAELIAETPLALTDDLDLAKYLSRIDAPTPAQLAKAEKIFLASKYGASLDFGDVEVCYQVTQKYGALTKGVELEAASLNLQLAIANQKPAVKAIFDEEIKALHHLPTAAQKAILIERCGILNLLDGQKYATDSPEMLEFKEKCLNLSDGFHKFMGLTFTSEQTPATFLRRLANRLKITLKMTRPGKFGVNNPRVYQAYTSESIAEDIQAAQLKLAEKQAELSQVENLNKQAHLRMKQLEVDSVLGGLLDEETSKLMKSIDVSGKSITSGASEAIEQLDKSITAQIERLKELSNVASQVAVRKDLLAAALKRYQAISEVSMNDFNNIETSDIESQRLQKGINTYQLDPPEEQETA
jgi:ABC-type oligopeptide transport system ATPase subunit